MTKDSAELLKEQIRARYCQEIITDILMNLGYDFDKNKKFKLRKEEKTASSSVNKNGLINDFGGSGGDIIKILTDYHAMSFIDAMKYVADYMNISYSDDDNEYDEFEKQKRIQEIETLKLERLKKREIIEREEYQLLLKNQENAKKTIAWYETYKHELQTFNNQEYKKEALEIAPIWLFQEATQDAIKQFKYLTSYDLKNKTIIAKIFDYNGNLISYKRRRYLIQGDEKESKWVTKSGTSPNKQCLCSIKCDGPIYIIEGHHDMLTASLIHHDEFYSFNFIMVPTENYHKFNEFELQFLKNRDINFIFDAKKDNIDKSSLSMRHLASSLNKRDNEKAVLINLFDFLHENKINHNEMRKIDLSDAINKWDKSKKEFISLLEYHADCIRSAGEIF